MAYISAAPKGSLWQYSVEKLQLLETLEFRPKTLH
jgi:hypothetical protein